MEDAKMAYYLFRLKENKANRLEISFENCDAFSPEDKQFIIKQAKGEAQKLEALQAQGKKGSAFYKIYYIPDDSIANQITNLCKEQTSQETALATKQAFKKNVQQFAEEFKLHGLSSKQIDEHSAFFLSSSRAPISSNSFEATPRERADNMPGPLPSSFSTSRIGRKGGVKGQRKRTKSSSRSPSPENEDADKRGSLPSNKKQKSSTKIVASSKRDNIPTTSPPPPFQRKPTDASEEPSKMKKQRPAEESALPPGLSTQGQEEDSKGLYYILHIRDREVLCTQLSALSLPAQKKIIKAMSTQPYKDKRMFHIPSLQKQREVAAAIQGVRDKFEQDPNDQKDPQTLYSNIMRCFDNHGIEPMLLEEIGNIPLTPIQAAVPSASPSPGEEEKPISIIHCLVQYNPETHATTIELIDDSKEAGREKIKQAKEEIKKPNSSSRIGLYKMPENHAHLLRQSVTEAENQFRTGFTLNRHDLTEGLYYSATITSPVTHNALSGRLLDDICFQLDKQPSFTKFTNDIAVVAKNFITDKYEQNIFKELIEHLYQFTSLGDIERKQVGTNFDFGVLKIEVAGELPIYLVALSGHLEADPRHIPLMKALEEDTDRFLQRKEFNNKGRVRFINKEQGRSAKFFGFDPDRSGNKYQCSETKLAAEGRKLINKLKQQGKRAEFAGEVHFAVDRSTGKANARGSCEGECQPRSEAGVYDPDREGLDDLNSPRKYAGEPIVPDSPRATRG
ncbi:MAG: hypothetical protein K0S27_1406 [Gammaproteobacteria bacterium]|nr:hypothetical protein [Gammaproteobacteria bacterium]